MQPSPLNHVVAFVQPFQLDAVVDALRRLPNFPGMSVSEVRGFGAHLAHPQPGQGREVEPFENKARIEVFCRSSELMAIIETIRMTARTGQQGDGKIFASPVTMACRVRTGEWGEGAVLESPVRT